MSNAEVVRRALVLTNDPREDLSDVYEGFDGLRQYRVDLRKVWHDVSFEPQEIVDKGNDVLVTTRMIGLGRVSGVPIDEPGVVLYQLAGGRIEHIRFIGTSRDAAVTELRDRLGM